ncbi:MarR family winged helix-turn-helix transcriptional regulator [Litoreibacter janthinus]|uniref:DNA-binding transcriptional regulator, MarR family n=1 Tax=Litoreibacter janthinus TaxID=670154 RepID=A0A1I6GI17_9RHOB|nr:MarR family transcriptional regulator [Litoreibacter janthinus]SFR41828.1 DNA-binding transcriptional regulator, MarR family [Litoreibacter janthinus]
MIIENKRYALHDSIGYQATLTSRAFERRLEEGLRKLGLSRLGWCVLLAIGEEKRESPSEIASFIGVDRTATSRALKVMEANGLLTRAESHEDARRTDVALTPSGANLLTRAIAVARENSAHFNGKLRDDEKTKLSELLGKLRAGEDDSLLTNF